jgi:hypothetical protein
MEIITKETYADRYGTAYNHQYAVMKNGQALFGVDCVGIGSHPWWPGAEDGTPAQAKGEMWTSLSEVLSWAEYHLV